MFHLKYTWYGIVASFTNFKRGDVYEDKTTKIKYRITGTLDDYVYIENCLKNSVKFNHITKIDKPSLMMFEKVNI